MATSNHQTTGGCETCPQCLGQIRDDPTERVCGRCGLVVEDSPMDHGAEYRNMSDGEDRRHYANGDPNRGDKGLGSFRSWRIRDKRDSRLLTWEARTRETSKDENRDYATTEINRIGVAVGVSRPVIERAQYIFRELHREGDLHGNDLDVLAPACLHLACREHDAGRTVREIAEYARAEKRMILRRVHWVADVAGVGLSPPSVTARIRVLAGRLALPEPAIRRVLDYYRDIDDPSATSGEANTLAALCLWQATGETQQRVAEVAGCSAGGIRKRRQQLD